LPTSYTIKVDGSGLGQTKDSTCWYAAYALLYRAVGLPFGGIRRDMEAAGLNFQDYYDNGLPRTDYLKARNALKLQSTRAGYMKNLADDASGFCRWLMTNGPFWCSIERRGKLHVILVHGYDASFKQVIALNPWNNVNAGQAEFMPIPISDYKSWVTDDAASCQHHPGWVSAPYDPSKPD
jgi:hypothetical protein